jgi:hypothetical protein
MSPDERGNFSGGLAAEPAAEPALVVEVEAREGEEEVLVGAGLCFITNSLSPPKLNEAISGFAPRKRSSSEWKDILSLPVE